MTTVRPAQPTRPICGSLPIMAGYDIGRCLEESGDKVPRHITPGKARCPMALEREIETYRRKLSGLLAEKGKYVVIHGEDIVGTFDGLDDAMRAGYARTLTEPFLVRRIAEDEPILVSSRNLRPCP